MSVLIKDMELPTSCTMCWLNTFCGVWNTEPAKRKGFNKRLEDCPIAEQIMCKDCKHWYSDADTGMACEFTNLSQPEDGFCNWAERRKHDE